MTAKIAILMPQINAYHAGKGLFYRQGNARNVKINSVQIVQIFQVSASNVKMVTI